MTATFLRSNDGLSWLPETPGEIMRLLGLLFKGAEVSTFEYWGDFILRIQRNNVHVTAETTAQWGTLRIPPLFGLRLSNDWWIGSRSMWSASLKEIGAVAKARGAPAEKSLQAISALGILGLTITGIEARELGSLGITLSNGEQLCVLGAGAKWEEAWQFELPVDDPDRDRWSIACDSTGVIRALWPLAAQPADRA